MIARLKGTLLEKTTDSVIVDVGGVGYLVFASLSTLADLPRPGGEVELRIHTHVRDDAIDLYGFLEPVEEAVFEKLIQTPSIGCKKAVNILSSLPAAEVVDAVRTGDAARLARAHGIGKKTADRLVLELEGRFGDLGATRPPAEGAREEDLVSGLTHLGFKEDAARDAAREVTKSHPDEELPVLLREAIHLLRGG